MNYRDGLTLMGKGEKFSLSNGLVVTSGSLSKIATSLGCAVSQPTMLKRLQAGERDFDRLTRQPSEAASKAKHGPTFRTRAGGSRNCAGNINPHRPSYSRRLLRMIRDEPQ